MPAKPRRKAADTRSAAVDRAGRLWVGGMASPPSQEECAPSDGLRQGSRVPTEFRGVLDDGRGKRFWQPSCLGVSPAPHPTLPHKGGGLFWLPPPLWGRAGVGGVAMADEVPGGIATPPAPVSEK